VACGPPADTDDAVQCGRELATELGGGLRLIAPNVAAADEWLDHAQRLAPTASATRVAGYGRAALVDQTRSETDILVSGRADEELLRQTVCPVLIVPASDSDLRPVSAATWR
jgi:hypothetical protein